MLFIAGFHFFRRFLLAGIARFRILLLRLATVTTIIVAALAAVTSGTVITGVAAFVTIATVVLPWLATILLTLRFFFRFRRGCFDGFRFFTAEQLFQRVKEAAKQTRLGRLRGGNIILFAVATLTAGSTGVGAGGTSGIANVASAGCSGRLRSAYSSSEGSAIASSCSFGSM